MESEQKDEKLDEWSTVQLITKLMFNFGCVTTPFQYPTSQIRHRTMVEKKKPGRPKGTTSPILEENTALVLELHRRQVDNTNIARIVGVTPPTVAAFLKRKKMNN